MAAHGRAPQDAELRVQAMLFTELVNRGGSTPERVGALHDEVYDALH